MPQAPRASTRRSGICRCQGRAATGARRPRSPTGLTLLRARGRRRSSAWGPAYRRIRLGQVLLNKKCLVASVGQALDRIVDGQPEELVDLDSGPETAALHLHHPIARDLVAPTAVHICSAAQGAHKLATQPPLLPHLTQRALFGTLVGFDLALRQSPVVVGGPVDDRDLRFAGSPSAADNAASGSDHAHICYFQDLCCQRCSFVS